MKRRKIEEYPPIIVAIILTIAFVIVGGANIYKAAEAERGRQVAEPEYKTAEETPKAETAFFKENPKMTAVYTGYVVLEERTAPPEDRELNVVEAETTEPERRTLIGSRDWDAYDSEVLLRIAMAEAEGEPTEGKALVMLVVLNRVWTEGFPNSIEDVVMQNSGGCYQFSPVAPGGRYWTKEPNEDCYRALEMVMYEGWDESDGALYFENCNGESWQAKNCEYLFTVGNHSFYR
ncbi:N-acetylmuramoyl-L-alanine amidase [Fusobacterium naviforme]|nr:cell wall hydrolase [Fusobacterium naviforme]PSL10226.1 N-acetylmuramoyl-L-alanine amidase [Fusobacterium naviforme]STO27636.1 Spore cortex-lytic enzyme precursor [Fusobacterium naviforme]